MIYGRIYCITNSVNGKRYVGQTTRPVHYRFKQHLSLIGACRAMGNAIRKYGADAFSVQELATADSQVCLNELERLWIARLNTIRPNGYNLMIGGSGGPMHQETREKIKIANTGKTPSQATRIKLKLSHMGLRPTDETRRKMSAALRLRRPSEETIEKLRKAGIGHVVSEETRAKIASALRGRRIPEETKKKISMTNAGRVLGPPMSVEGKARIVAANIKRVVSPETRMKLSELSKGRKNTLGRVWVNNGTSRTLCWPDDVARYVDAGWSLGTGKQNRKKGDENGRTENRTTASEATGDIAIRVCGVLGNSDAGAVLS